MRISDWSSDVCSSDLELAPFFRDRAHGGRPAGAIGDVEPDSDRFGPEIPGDRFDYAQRAPRHSDFRPLGRKAPRDRLAPALPGPGYQRDLACQNSHVAHLPLPMMPEAIAAAVT